MGNLFDGYRPELHYMRGPGPRWHEKHDRARPADWKEQHEQDYALWLVPAAVALIGVAAAAFAGSALTGRARFRALRAAWLRWQ